jgi:hypothetical protein
VCMYFIFIMWCVFNYNLSIYLHRMSESSAVLFSYPDTKLNDLVTHSYLDLNTLS